MSSQLDYKAIRKRAEEQFQRDKRNMRLIFFIINLIMLIVFLIVSWSLFLNNGGLPPSPSGHTDDPLTTAMVLLSTASFIGVVFQAVSLIMETKIGGRQMRDRAMGRALSEEMLRLEDETGEPQEKAKHMMQLNDDGELEAIVDEDDEAEVEQQIKRQARQNR